MRAATQERRRAGLQDVRGSVLAGHNGSLHEPLFIGQVFPGEINAFMRLLQYGPQAKPLSGTVKRICALRVLILLPWLGFNIGCHGGGWENPAQILFNQRLQLVAAASVQVIRLIANRITAKNAARALLVQRGVKNKIRSAVGETRKLRLSI